MYDNTSVDADSASTLRILLDFIAIFPVLLLQHLDLRPDSFI